MNNIHAYYTAKQYALMAQALELGERVRDHREENYTRKEVAVLIQGSMSGFFVKNSPIPALRKLFPYFHWEFHDLSHFEGSAYVRAIRKLVRRVDIFWAIKGINSDTLVSACLKTPKTEEHLSKHPWSLCAPCAGEEKEVKFGYSPYERWLDEIGADSIVD